MLKALLVLIALYAILIVGLYTMQRRLMYHPTYAIRDPKDYGLAQVDEHEITASDGIKLALWVHSAKAGFPTLVYFHGNAGNLGDREGIFKAFIAAGFGLVAVEYRGFGKSGGSPSEQGIYSDARAAIDYAATTMHLPQTQLIYYGESLGTGVAVQMATERPPALLMLEAPYTSVTTRSAELFSYVIGIRYLLHDHYDSLSKIASIHVPLVIIHGQRDPIIPVAHGKALFAAANEPKQIFLYPEIGHIEFSDEQRVLPLLDGAKKRGLISLQP